MPEQPDNDAVAEQSEPRRRLSLPQGAFGGVLFGLGVTLGFLAAFIGVGLFEQVLGTILTALLVALIVIGVLGGVAFLFRRRLMRRLFGVAEIQLEEFASPLADVARGAIARDPDGATAAARELVQRALARYAWMTTRRWLVASLTALIAAMAALAGTAMLFRQNLLLEQQIALTAAQNEWITRQTLLAELGVELAEASRNGQLAVEITAVAEELGRLLDRGPGGKRAEARDAPGEGGVTVLDPLRDLGAGTRLRIVAASKAARPYRFLDGVISPDDDAARLRAAMERRRDDLPRAWANLARAYGWAEAGPGGAGAGGGPRLIDRPASPERGLLLRTLLSAGVRQMETLNFLGLDLSHSFAPSSRLLAVSFQMGQLSFAELSRSEVNGSDFGGAMLSGVRLRGARILDTSFAAVSGAQVKPPFSPQGRYATDLMGADLSGAFLRDVRMDGARMIAANLDGAVLLRSSLAGAGLTGATLRGAVLLDVDLNGAVLARADLDGAMTAGADALERIAAAAAPGSFSAGDYRLEPVTPAEVMSVEPVFLNLDEAELVGHFGERGFFRLIRVAPLEPPR